MSKNFMLVIVAIVIVLGGIFWFSNKNGSTTTNSSTSGAKPTNHVSGLDSKHLTLIEYGDYQCPVCGAYYSTVKQVAQKYNQEIYFQFRNLPLSQIHPNAVAAARAAEAAGLQNKYWEMHDSLYEQQTVWASASSPYSFFENMAGQIGLNIAKFKQDYQSTAVNDSINADLAEFNKTGQQLATPSFFLNGVFIDNSKLIDKNGPSLAKFSAIIDPKLK